MSIQPNTDGFDGANMVINADAEGVDHAELLIRARSALLDALAALERHLGSVVVIGAQAIYLQVGAAVSPVAESTKDSDLVLDTRNLAASPLIEKAMRDARFKPNLENNQPGAWLSPDDIPVDLMVPETLASGKKGGRSGGPPPHDKRALRRTVGLEATIVDFQPMTIGALTDSDDRVFTANVAGPAALLIAKLHKVGERVDDPKPNLNRLIDKDAHDIYRILIGIDTEPLAESLHVLRTDDLAGPATNRALNWLETLFAASPDAPGCQMAARTEAPFGTADTVAQQSTNLARDLLNALET